MSQNLIKTNFFKALKISCLLLLSGCGQETLKEEYAVARDPTWYPKESVAQNKGVVPFRTTYCGPLVKMRVLESSSSRAIGKICCSC